MTVPLRSDLSVPDLCASAFSSSLRDQISVYPSIAAGDLPLNGSLVDGLLAELITQRTRRRRERRGPVQNAWFFGVDCGCISDQLPAAFPNRRWRLPCHTPHCALNHRLLPDVPVVGPYVSAAGRGDPLPRRVGGARAHFPRFKMEIAARNELSFREGSVNSTVFSCRLRRGYCQRGKETAYGQEMRNSRQTWRNAGFRA